jgi:hypothetical protein
MKLLSLHRHSNSTRIRSTQESVRWTRRILVTFGDFGVTEHDGQQIRLIS